jgi:prolyl-tRNA editing enzyme YbaK/EbsC (Cys-tRNA(Pro) deacylase)
MVTGWYALTGPFLAGPGRHEDGVGRRGLTMPSGPEHLEAYLLRQGVEARIIRPGRSTATVSEAAAALGVSPGQIVKSLVFQDKDGRTALVVTRGVSRVDRRKLSQVTGLRQPQLAPPETVLDLTGYQPGATPPVGHLVPLTVVVDRAVLKEAVVYGGGGEKDVMLCIRPQDILQLTGALVADVATDETVEASTGA